MYARHFSLITKLFSGVVLILPVLYVVTSLFANETPKLPVFMEIPYLPMDGWPFFHTMCFMQISAMWVGANLAVGIEVLTFFYIQYVCCRIEILTQMIEHWNDNIKCSRSDLDVRNNNMLLQEIVRYHSSIKRNMDAIRSIFSPMLMATLLSNSIVICMCLVIIFVVNVLSIEILLLITKYLCRILY